MHEDRGIAADVVAGPEPADVGQQADRHRITALCAGKGTGAEGVSGDDGARPVPGVVPTGSAPSPDDIGGSPALIRSCVCGDSSAGVMIRRFRFSYVISQLGPLYRLMGKNADSP
ncbi:hypothetical protein GCM10014719_00180 [Planomonospora parontospora subsp. antibiotica]|nr:hypothetical protein GCM10014719_00180 [Planomonospora parontospora subsp. antibiotica]GII16810.1 hypothetical protein Ppa05_35360 [Planomonospora parontospora subsp. antibiotica]